MEPTNQLIETTWGITLRIWWWIMWRALLAVLIGSVVFGFFFGFSLRLAGVSEPVIEFLVEQSGMILGVSANIFFVKKVIGKRFKDVRLVLIKEE